MSEEKKQINLGKVIPKKGVDYWTEADKEEIVTEVLKGIADGDEAAYGD